MNVVAQGIEISEIPQSISSGELKLYLDNSLSQEELQLLQTFYASESLRIITIPLTQPAVTVANQVASSLTSAKIIGWQILSNCSTFWWWFLGGFVAYYILTRK